MAGFPEKLLLHWPVQQRQQAATVGNIGGQGVQSNKNMPGNDAERKQRCKRCARQILRSEQVANGQPVDRLHHADIAGSVAQGSLGLGCSTRASWNRINLKEHGAGGCLQGRGGKQTHQGSSHEQVGQLD